MLRAAAGGKGGAATGGLQRRQLGAALTETSGVLQDGGVLLRGGRRRAETNELGCCEGDHRRRGRPASWLASGEDHGCTR